MCWALFLYGDERRALVQRLNNPGNSLEKIRMGLMKKQTIACWKYLEPRLTKLVLFPEKTKYMNQYLQLTNFQNDIKKNILKAVG